MAESNKLPSKQWSCGSLEAGNDQLLAAKCESDRKTDLELQKKVGVPVHCPIYWMNLCATKLFASLHCTCISAQISTSCAGVCPIYTYNQSLGLHIREAIEEQLAALNDGADETMAPVVSGLNTGLWHLVNSSFFLKECCFGASQVSTDPVAEAETLPVSWWTILYFLHAMPSTNHERNFQHQHQPLYIYIFTYLSSDFVAWGIRRGAP